jgi:hypothetical protein
MATSAASEAIAHCESERDAETPAAREEMRLNALPPRGGPSIFCVVVRRPLLAEARDKGRERQESGDAEDDRG